MENSTKNYKNTAENEKGLKIFKPNFCDTLYSK